MDDRTSALWRTPQPVNSAAITRRQALGRGMALGVGMLGAGGFVRALTSADVAHAALPPRYAMRLPAPPVLTSAEVQLIAAETEVQVLTGAPTRMWTFNGSFPGPTIRRPSGEPSYVTVHNRLPADAGSLTIHHHGSHAPASEDGQPEREVIPIGDGRRYWYPNVEDGGPERAAMQWYHDHSLLRTGKNVWRGLAGVSILEDDHEAALGLPDGDREVVLVLCDRAFDAGNQLIDPFTAPVRETLSPVAATGQGFPPFDEVVGDVHLVNGVVAPFLDVEPTTYRLRVLNASNFQPYNLQIAGAQIVQIGNESGLMPRSVTREAVLIGPAERVDLIVDFSRLAGRRITLDSVARTDGGVLPVQSPALAKLLRFDVGATRTRPAYTPPARPRELPAWATTLSAVPDRVWAVGLGVDGGGRVAWTINGQAYDHARIDARPVLGTSETWMFANVTPSAASHYIHLHDVDWVMLSRNGATPPVWEQGLKDTFRLDPGDVIVIGTKFTDHVGNYMFHCHLLEHEDHGMMANWEVVRPGAGDLPLPARTVKRTRINGRVVRVPIGQVRGAAQQDCLSRVLDQIAARPGRRAAVPRGIPAISPDPAGGPRTSAASVLCRLLPPSL